MNVVQHYAAFIQVVQHYIVVQHITKTTTLNRKLRNLAILKQNEEKPTVKPVSYPNLSSMNFSNDEHYVLSLGPKFMLHNKTNLKAVVADCESIAFLYRMKVKKKFAVYFFTV